MTNLACAVQAPLSPKEYDNLLALAWEKGALAGIQAVPSPMHLVASDMWGRPLPGAPAALHGLTLGLPHPHSPAG